MQCVQWITGATFLTFYWSRLYFPGRTVIKLQGAYATSFSPRLLRNIEWWLNCCTFGLIKKQGKKGQKIIFGHELIKVIWYKFKRTVRKARYRVFSSIFPWSKVSVTAQKWQNLKLEPWAWNTSGRQGWHPNQTFKSWFYACDKIRPMHVPILIPLRVPKIF